jgi:hypothetical protein
VALGVLAVELARPVDGLGVEPVPATLPSHGVDRR